MYLMPRGHIYHYTYKTIDKFLEKAGFSDIRFFVGEPTHVMLVGNNECHTRLVPLKIAYVRLAQIVYWLTFKKLYLSNSINLLAKKI
ncbi:MAG: hypothetical protein A2161_08680 [Candidatus Schekmanbacteria bacterium RBG_13_48_7]|uniref:Uncharacterized protein n=1 Tax=Candidatus Schekmanbacteria bacterium RBG_13_48_7 TaxID=1817878 RepID=A0A1F7RLR4_9BACT|nr:MAG: hypothetical protein A2161_08680 [Candidatus Schekmanbacteria bacterium RBG_13_48_7]